MKEILIEIANGSIDAIERLDNIEKISSSEKTQVSKFFRDYEFRKNNWHTSNLIDLLNDFEIYDEDFFKKILNLLVEKGRDYFVKLSALDYLFRYVEVLNNDNIQLLEVALLHKNRLVVKNQILLFLLAFSPFEKDRVKYKQLLVLQLKRTVDYRAHIRLYNSIMNYFERFSYLDNDFLISLTKSTEFNFDVRSVNEKIKEFRLFIVEYR